MRLFRLSFLTMMMLGACSTPKPSPSIPIPSISYPCIYQPLRQGGAFYKDDGPGKDMPANINSIIEPIPMEEPLHRFANRPYTVLGKNYTPQVQQTNFVQEGIGSWYGRKFHGQNTSSGEPYDMYAMTAAHPTLPIPSYVRVTNQENSRSVVVRINDRGPFHKERVIDLSFLAACRLGYAENGSAPLKVEALLPSQSMLPTTNVIPPAAHRQQEITQISEMRVALPLFIPLQGNIFIQLGAFSAQSNAESFRIKVAETLNQPLDHIRLYPMGGIIRVRMGPFKNKETAMKEVERLTDEHHLQAVVVH